MHMHFTPHVTSEQALTGKMDFIETRGRTHKKEMNISIQLLQDPDLSGDQVLLLVTTATLVNCPARYKHLLGIKENPGQRAEPH